VSSLFSVKRGILALSPGDRVQLILWIAQGMPAPKAEEELSAAEDGLTHAQRKEQRDAMIQRAICETAERAANRRRPRLDSYKPK
jgi:hypothetical protein